MNQPQSVMLDFPLELDCPIELDYPLELDCPLSYPDNSAPLRGPGAARPLAEGPAGARNA